MPTFKPVQHALNGGELAPGAFARTDITKYQSGLTCAMNVRMDPLGGAVKRPGITYIGETKFSQFESVLVPFQFSVSRAYMLEFGCEYIRFYRNNTRLQGTPELVTNGGFDINLTGWTVWEAAAWNSGMARLPSSPEIVTNGHFTTNVSGWNQTGVTSVDGAAHMTTSAFMNQSKTLTSGANYRFEHQIVAGTVGVSLTNTTYLGTGTADPLDLGVDVYSCVVTATGTTTVIQFDNRPAPSGTSDVDNVSLRRVESAIQQNVTVQAGVEYQLTYTIAGSGLVLVDVGTTTCGTELSSGHKAAGSYTQTVTSPTTTLSLRFTSDVDNDMDVDDVSVSATTTLEVTTPYLSGQVTSVVPLQSADEMYLLHACHPTRKLQRYGDTCWRFICVTFTPMPSTEYGARPTTEVQPSALSGQNVTITAFNGSTFLASDVGREVKITGGENAGARAGIKSVTSATAVVTNVCVPFNSTAVSCRGTWILTFSPQTTITPSDDGPEGKSSNLTLAQAGWRGTVSGGETDCGKFVSLNGGHYEITCVVSTTLARSIVRSAATATTAGEAGAWSLEEALWSTTRGFASTGDFFNDRLYLNADYRFVGSKTSDYENFAAGANADDAVIFGINAKTINTIMAIVGGRDLQIFTRGAEFIAQATDGPITPTDVQILPQTRVGSSTVQPLITDNATLFLGKFGRELREFVVPADSINDEYRAPDLLLLASHLTRDAGIRRLAYQSSPSPTIYGVRSDGTMLVCAYRREENVVAWSRWETQGVFEDVAVIPHPDGDREQVWVIARLLVGGASKRYLGYFDDSTLTYPQRFTDWGTTITSASGCSIAQGLSHLECATVQILADGRYAGTCVVTGGLVGLASPANEIEVGLGYTAELITLHPGIEVAGGNVMLLRKGFSEAYFRAIDSCGVVQVRQGTGEMTGTRMPTWTEKVLSGPGVQDYEVPVDADWLDARLTLRAEQPLPFHILVIGGTLSVGG